MRNRERKVRWLNRAAVFAGLMVAPSLMPVSASAEDFFSFLFGGGARQQPASELQTPAFADPLAAPAQAIAPKAASGSGRSSGYCVRTCDGRYFPVVSAGQFSAAQVCQAFCPASVTRLYSGASIENAVSSSGERYSDSDNAFAYRKALRSDCTCNGRDPAGLAPVDLTFDTTLKAGDVVATADGLMAYTGVRLGAERAADFTPVASYPGLTASVRARLGEIKVTPVSADIAEDSSMPADITASIAPVAAQGRVIGLRERRD